MEYVAATPSAVSLAGGATPIARTVLMLVGNATISAVLKEMGVFFDGVTASNTPVLVELVKSTQATNGTNGAVVTPVQWRGPGNTSGSGNAALLTAYAGYVSEPTVLTVVQPYLVPPTTGAVLPLPLGDECEIIASATFGLGLRITPPQAINVRAYMRFMQGVT